METNEKPPQLKRPVDSIIPVSCEFGVRGEHWKSGWHEGVDFAAPLGTPVLAAWDGIAAWAGDGGDGFGFYVRLSHFWKGLAFLTYYCHLTRSDLKRGQEVNCGDVIGVSGNSGNVTGPHLHFGLKAYNLWTKPAFFDEIPKPA